MFYLISITLAYLLIGTIWHGYVVGVNKQLDKLFREERNAHWLYALDIPFFTVCGWPFFFISKIIVLIIASKISLLWSVPFNAIVGLGERTVAPKQTVASAAKIRIQQQPQDQEAKQRQRELQEAEAEVERCLTEDKYSQL